MSNNEYMRKEFKFKKDTITKIEQLKNIYQSENIESKTYDKDIIIDAINLLYSSKFGKDVFDQTMNKLENVLGNMLTSVLNEYVIRFATSLDHIYTQNEQSKEMLLLILKANDILPESQNELNSLIMMNAKLDEYIKEAVLLKQELNKS